MSLYIAGGEFKGYKLKSPPDKNTRPTSAKLRAAIFNILRGSVNGARFLDLYAGTGAVGFEALSEGASSVYLVEIQKKAFQMLRENGTKFPQQKLHYKQQDSADFCLQNKNSSLKFDIIFADPPFDMDYSKILTLAPALLAKDAVFLVQFPTRNQPNWVKPPSEIKNYGESGLAIFYT